MLHACWDRGPLYSRDDIKNDEEFGFKIIHCDEFQTQGTDKIAERIKKEWVVIHFIYQ